MSEDLKTIEAPTKDGEKIMVTVLRYTTPLAPDRQSNQLHFAVRADAIRRIYTSLSGQTTLETTEGCYHDIADSADKAIREWQAAMKSDTIEGDAA